MHKKSLRGMLGIAAPIAKNVTKNSGVKFQSGVTRVLCANIFQKWEKNGKNSTLGTTVPMRTPTS